MQIKCWVIIGFVVFCVSCASKETDKINGVSFVASGIAIDSSHVTPLAKLNANYAAIMPFAYTKGVSNPNIIHSFENQWFGESEAGVKQYVAQLRKANIKIMLKPQIWVMHGSFTGFIKMNNEADWNTLEASYTNFILTYAKLATAINAEILCIGTELETFIAHRPEYWNQLVPQIRQIYKGKLTYAANWNEYTRTPFLNQLDYIGIDAYFPVSKMQTPTVEDCKKGWQTHKALIKRYSDSLQKPILFTEFGYRSVDYNGKKPWDVNYQLTSVNLNAQQNATQALFEEFWKEDWFAGGFVWKWFVEHNKVGGKDDNRFTPQNKPVETVIKNWYLKY